MIGETKIIIIINLNNTKEGIIKNPLVPVPSVDSLQEKIQMILTGPKSIYNLSPRFSKKKLYLINLEKKSKNSDPVTKSLFNHKENSSLTPISNGTKPTSPHTLCKQSKKPNIQPPPPSKVKVIIQNFHLQIRIKIFIIIIV